MKTRILDTSTLTKHNEARRKWCTLGLVADARRLIMAFLLLIVGITSSTAFAQRTTSQGVSRADSLCRQSVCTPRDTTKLARRLPLFRLSPLYPIHGNRPNTLNPKVLSWPKFDPDREKFSKLQLINTIGTHISR